jgi:hypothetical protein
VPEYSLNQAGDLAQLAIEGLAKQANDGGVRARNCLYLAHLSIELALKAVLEQAGMPVNDIRRMSHNLLTLSKAVGGCSFTYELGQGRGVVIRDLRVTKDGEYLSFGHFVEATQWESFSSYPGELRYGNDVTHFDPEMVAQLARELCKWFGARIHTFLQCE